MTKETFYFEGCEIEFSEGESIASALTAAGILTFGKDAAGRDTRYFCGIGVCQCCLVRVNGNTTEACLTPAEAGLNVKIAGEPHA